MNKIIENGTFKKENAKLRDIKEYYVIEVDYVIYVVFA